MNNITKQVITELETIKAIASELADMSPRTQMEIVALCKEICLNVDKVLEKHDIDIETLFNYVNTLESEMEEIRQLIDPQHLASIDERLEDLEASILTINESIGGINQTLSTHTNQIQGLENNKQDVLTAGENITIENNVISASGGGSELYEHIILLQFLDEGGAYSNEIYLKIINDNNNPFTMNALTTFLHNLSSLRYPCNGYFRGRNVYNNNKYGIVYKCGYIENASVENIYFILFAYASTISASTVEQATTTKGITLTDTIRQI